MMAIERWDRVGEGEQKRRQRTHGEADHLHQQLGEVVPLGLHVSERLAQRCLVAGARILQQLAPRVLDLVQVLLLHALLHVQLLDLLLQRRRVDLDAVALE